jgi:16S rRNA (uracil1498-N3)-methyltransferase
MRAHWVKDLSIEELYILKDDSLHHLVHVIRLEAGEELLLLNGKGLAVKTLVESISKRELRLKFLSSEVHEHKYNFDLALGLPKKDAFDLCLKQATELGFRKIYFIRSDYSQFKIPDEERIESLLVSALEQSNAPFLPMVAECKFETLPWNEYSEILFLDSQTKTQNYLSASDALSPRLLVVGPEGGFSPSELSFLHGVDRVKVVNLPTPILRTPTALATGAGMMLESLLK